LRLPLPADRNRHEATEPQKSAISLGHERPLTAIDTH
jgi:hypothetical protein